jgi:hypothetical protein
MNALNIEEKAKQGFEQCIFRETLQEKGFKTLRLVNSTYPFTI